MKDAKQIVKNRPKWLTKAVLSADEFPPFDVRRKLVDTAMTTRVEGVRFWDIGKQLQHDNPGKIPDRAELEVVAGYWHWLRVQLGIE